MDNQAEQQNKDTNPNPNPNEVVEIKLGEPIDWSQPFGDMNTLLETIKKRATSLKRDYNFAMNYSQLLVSIFKQTSTLLNERIGNTVKENKIFIQFFKEITNAYMEFSNLMTRTSQVFKKDTSAMPKMFEDSVSKIAEKTQVLLTSHFSNFSTTLQSKILAKGPFVKIDQINNDILAQQKEITKRIGKIENRRKKLLKLYSTSYELLLKSVDGIKDGPALDALAEETPDFIMVELDLRTYINKMFSKTNAFLTDTKAAIKKMNELIKEFIKLVMDAVLIYLQENKKIYSQYLMEAFQEVETFYHLSSKTQKEAFFLSKKVFNDEKELINVEVLLTKYQATFLEANRISNPLLSDNDNFKINLYETVESFIDFLIKLNPVPDKLNYDNLLVTKLEVRRYAGLFAGWKNSIMLASKQKHLIVFDEKIDRTCTNLFEISKLSFKSKPEKNNLYQLEIIVNKKGKIMNMSTGSYFFDAKNGRIYNYLANLFTSINKINEPEKK